jgi:PAS domain S-box-containing protein
MTSPGEAKNPSITNPSMPPERDETGYWLRDSEARFRALTELSSDWYWEQDEHLRFVYLSDGFAERAGISAGQVLGRTRWDIDGLAVNDADRRKVDAIHAERRPFRDVVVSHEAEDGSVRYTSISGTPIFDGNGCFRGYRGMGRDVTDQQRMFRAVAEHEARMSLALAYGNVGIWEQDLASDRVRCSVGVGPMFGLPDDTAEVSAGTLFDRIHPADRERFEITPDGVADAQLEQGFEHRVIWPDGTVRWIYQRGRVMQSPHTGERLRLGIVQDITERKEAEIALRASEERVRVLVELSSDFYWEQDAAFRFTAFQQGGFGTVGPPIDTHVGRTPWEIDALNAPPEGWADRRAKLDQHLPFRDVVRHRRTADGEVRTLLVSGFPAFDFEGRFEGYRGVAKDITERERDHRKVLDSEARFRGLTALSADWYWEQDAQFRYTMLSENYYRLSKFPQGTWLGHTRWDAANTNVSAEEWAQHRRVLENHQPFYDLIVERPDAHGRLTVHSVSGIPIFDDGGRFTGYRGVARDITAAKAAENALKESEQRFRLLAENTRDIVWISDPAIEHFDYVSQSVLGIVGISAETLLVNPMAWVKLIHPDDVAVGLGIAETQKRGEVVDVEFRIVRPDGELRWLWVRSNPARNSKGEAIVCGITEDITRQKLEHLQHLEDAARQRDALVREVHHRIKNSLQGVAGLLRSHARRDRPETLLEAAIAQIQAIATVHGLQGIGRGGGVEIVSVTDAIARMQQTLTRTPVRLQRFVAPGLRVILAEGEAVATALILNEVVVNAIKHGATGSPDDGIDVRVSACEQGVEVHVRNRGTLPEGFDLEAREGLGTGLDLVCSLMPKRGLTLTIRADEGWVVSILTIGPPIIHGLKDPATIAAVA